MSPEERQAYVRAVVASAPPLSAAQAATIRGTLLSGLEGDRPAERVARGKPPGPEEGEAPVAPGASPSPRIGIEGTDARTVQSAPDIGRARAARRPRQVA